MAAKHKFKAKKCVDVGFGIKPSVTKRIKKAKCVNEVLVVEGKKIL